MALIPKEKILKGLWDVVLIAASGAVCVFGSYLAVDRALARANAQLAASPAALPGGPAVAAVSVAGPAEEPAEVSPNGHAEEAAPKEAGHGAEKKSKKKGSKHEGGKEAKGGYTYPLKTTVVNLATDSSSRFAKVSITLEADSEEAVGQMKDVDHQIYDCLIDTLGNVRSQDIGSDAGKDMLKETLRSKMNKFLTEGKILNVYMTEFLVQ